MAMIGLFDPHSIEDGGRGGEVPAQAFAKIGVDALIFFLEGDGQSQDFPLR